MVPRLDAVDQRLDALRASTPVPAPHEMPNSRASTRCSDASSTTVCAGARRYSKCLWTERADWASWMASVQVRNRSEPFYNRRCRRAASENFGDRATNETGLYSPQYAKKRARLAVAKVDELMCYKFAVQNSDGEFIFDEETLSADGPQQQPSITKVPCEDDLKHISAQPWELSPSFQDSAYPSAKLTEQSRTEDSVSVDSAVWYADLKGDVVTAGETCDEKHEEPEPPTAVPGKFAPPELSAAMQAEVEAALKPYPQEQVLATGYSLVVRRADMITLSENQWINDTVINFYMSMLVNRSEQGSLRVYAFNTFFFTKLCRDGHAGLKRWTRKIDLFSYHVVLVPIHLSRHWFLAVVDFRRSQIALYDSFGAPHAKANCIDLLREYLEEESLHKRKHGIDWDDWKFIVAEDVPQQQNMSDCGMFTCQFAECISRDAPFQFTQQHMPYFRKRVVYEILHSTLL